METDTSCDAKSESNLSETLDCLSLSTPSSATQADASTMATMPQGVLASIASFLPAVDAARFACTSKLHAAASQPHLQALAIQWLSEEAYNVLIALEGCRHCRTRAVSADIVEHGLKDFHQKHCMGRDFGQRSSAELESAIQKLSCQILSDPRGVLRNRFVVMNNLHTYQDVLGERREWRTLDGVQPPASGNEVAESSDDTVTASSKFHKELLNTIYTRVIPVGQITSESLKDAEASSKFQQEMAGYDIDTYGDCYFKAKSVTYEQQQGYAKVTYNERESADSYESHYRPYLFNMGPLRSHCAVQFLRGWLCYKTGALPELGESIKLLRAAAQNPLLRPTCVVLAALAKFHAVYHHSHVPSGSNPPTPNLKWGIMVGRELFKALKHAVSAQIMHKHDGVAVETQLLADAVAACSLCLSSLQACGAKLEPSDVGAQCCRMAMALFFKDEGLPYGDDTSPTKLILEAGKAFRIDVPNCIPWDKCDELAAILAPKQGSSRFGSSWENKTSFDLVTTYPFKPYESCYKGGIELDRQQRVVSSSRCAGESSQWEDELIVKTVLQVLQVPIYVLPIHDGAASADWGVYPNPAECSRDDAAITLEQRVHTCQVCGAAASSVCSRCKVVRYCGSACQRLDWKAAHKDIFHMYAP